MVAENIPGGNSRFKPILTSILRWDQMNLLSGLLAFSLKLAWTMTPSQEFNTDDRKC